MNLFPPESGFLIIDKPEGITSHDVVLAVRRHLRIRKVGHLGTLDPMATGVLPIALGKATRLIEFLKEGPKVYEGTIRLGFSTNTYDKEGQPISERIQPQTNQEQLDRLAVEMSGEQWQVPPPFSAKKIQGVPAYRLARKGIGVRISPQRVQIHQLAFDLRGSDVVEFAMRCSAGTYVRSLAHDLGAKLGCGAHLSRLRRIASGEFSDCQTISLADFRRLSPIELSGHMIGLSKVLSHWPIVLADAAVEQALSMGRDFSVQLPEQGHREAKCLIRILSTDGRLLGLAEAAAVQERADRVSRPGDFWVHPVVVLVASKSN
jgi:tRNA pseudouridine55 synthase